MTRYRTLAEEQKEKAESGKKWDSHWLRVAGVISETSKDENTKVGCVIIGRNNEVRSTGYNGLPRGADDENSERQIRPEKYLWYEHAERNAIYNAARIGTPLSGSTAYITLCPCMDCARGLIQSGIKRIVTRHTNEVVSDIWTKQFMKSQQLFQECGVKFKIYE